MTIATTCCGCDERAIAETPILGLASEGRSYEFDLVARSEKLWHFRINKSDQVFIPKGATNFGHDNRHDIVSTVTRI